MSFSFVGNSCYNGEEHRNKAAIFSICLLYRILFISLLGKQSGVAPNPLVGNQRNNTWRFGIWSISSSSCTEISFDMCRTVLFLLFSPCVLLDPVASVQVLTKKRQNDCLLLSFYQSCCQGCRCCFLVKALRAYSWLRWFGSHFVTPPKRPSVPKGCKASKHQECHRHADASLVWRVRPGETTQTQLLPVHRQLAMWSKYFFLIVVVLLRLLQRNRNQYLSFLRKLLLKNKHRAGAVVLNSNWCSNCRMREYYCFVKLSCPDLHP